MHLIKYQNLLTIVLTIFLVITLCLSIPLDGSTISSSIPSSLNEDVSLSQQSLEGSGEEDSHLNKSQHLYVVKAVIYEIGILTEEDDNETSSSEEVHERVDLTFFDAHTNQSHIDLGNIPIPVQTNVSGQVLTGIAPINIGAFTNPADLLKTLPLTGTIVNITHSDTAFFKLSTQNSTRNSDELANSPVPDNILKLHRPINFSDDSNQT